MSSSRPPDFPRVYDICPTCGYDHDYDLPRLESLARRDAMVAHLKRDGAPPLEMLRFGGEDGDE